MDSLTGHVMTLANSIIGVSVLAMPYCFQQCGIVLSIVMLLISSIISRLACHFLLKSAIIARRKTFEFLAFHIFGGMGKFAIEIGIIGFLLGTCIAFFVVMGDLTPAIIAEISGIHTTSTMRTSILMALALFAVLPLGLLRNIDSLSGVSSATIGFYCCLVLKVIAEAIPHIANGDWYQNVNFWRTEGILQCLPIFSMALFCQTQLFEIYQAVQNATLEKMNKLVREAVNICTCVYIFVGIFGYIAFTNKTFTGNILLSFPQSILSDALKIGFIISVIFSFPLVIFPCRASLYSLLYKEGYTSLHEGTSNYIPEGKFKALTMSIVFVSLIIGILIPNIELVLGLVGSTIGVMICVLFPVTCFICISAKNTNERILAQILLLVGFTVMVLGTYKNLYSLDHIQNIEIVVNTPKNAQIAESVKINEVNFINYLPTTLKAVETRTQRIQKVTEGIKEVRHEPPQPEEPIEDFAKIKPVDVLPAKLEKFLLDSKSAKDLKNSNETKNEEVDIEAIKKEDKEVELQAKETVNNNADKVLLDTIQKQNEVQREIVEQQKKLIEVIQNQQNIKHDENVNKVNEEKLKAVKEIKNIALKAIEEISGKKEDKVEVLKVDQNDKGQPTVSKTRSDKKIESINKKTESSEPLLQKSVVSADNILQTVRKEVDKVVNNLQEDIQETKAPNENIKETVDANLSFGKNETVLELPKVVQNPAPKIDKPNNIIETIKSNANQSISNKTVIGNNRTVQPNVTVIKLEERLSKLPPLPMFISNNNSIGKEQQPPKQLVNSDIVAPGKFIQNKEIAESSVLETGNKDIQAMRRDILRIKDDY